MAEIRLSEADGPIQVRLGDNGEILGGTVRSDASGFPGLLRAASELSYRPLD